MEVLTLAGPCPGPAPAPVLLVMLPGAYSRPRDFVSEGFVDALRSRAIAADIALPDASLGYFEDRSVLRRLREDVVLPARERGTRQIWLIGISLGGFAALGYAARHGDEIAGVVALAPYLGRRTLIQQIAAAGGPRAWARATATDDDPEAGRWRALAGGRIVPPVYLGAGRDDRFADAHALLRTLLPAEHCFDTAGGHDWPPWRALWNAWLARGLLPTACDAA